MNTMTQAGYLASLQPCCPQHSVDGEIYAAIEEDIRMRHPGVTDGLYPIDILSGPRDSNRKFGIPMIEAHVPRPCDLATTDEVFRRRFGHDCPMLVGFDLKRHGMCLAGGAVCALMSNDTSQWSRLEIHDFDLFLVGHTEETARVSIKALRVHIASNTGNNISVYRTLGCITFMSRTSNRTPIQVVLRLYSTKAEIIHSFDLGSSSVLWDGEKIWMTALGRIAMQYGANVLNLRARRASLENRIVRYYKRGFSLILPELDVAAINKISANALPYLTHSRNAALCADARLPYLNISMSRESLFDFDDDAVHEVHEPTTSCCVIEMRGLIATRPGLDNNGHPPVSSKANYTMFGKDSNEAQEEPMLSEVSEYTFEIAYGNRRRLVLRNAYLLGQDELKIGGLCARSDNPTCDMFSIQPTLDSAEIKTFIEDSLRWSNAPDSRPLVRLFGKFEAASIMTQYLHTRDMQAVFALVEQRVAELNRRAVIPFAFMRVEDSTTLAGPNVEGDDDRTTGATWSVTPLQWYGVAYRPANAWRELLGATIIMARLGVTTYELLWVLQWAEPSILALSEARLVKLLERIRKRVTA